MNIINDMLVDKCFLDNANARAVVPAYKEKTDSGNPITLTDSVENKSLGMKLYGWSKQVVTTGKNLINADEYYSQFKQSDGTYKGENTVINKIAIPLAHFVGKRIVISANIDFPSTIDTMQIKAAIGENNYYGDIVYPNTNKRSVITVTVQTQNDNFWFTYGSGSGQVIISDIQAEIGSTATSYEPYTGGMGSPSPEYPQEIVSAGQKLSTGKNLINADEYYSQFKQSDGMYKVDDVKLNDIIIFFDSSMVGKTYTASCNLNCPNTVSGVALEANIDGKKVLGNIIPTNKSGISKVTFTPKTARNSIKITYESGRGDIIFSDFQIEAGSFATSYEPYTGGVPTLYQKDIEVRVTGKNLFDANDVSKGYVSDDSGNNIVATNSYCSNFITVSAKTKYYLYSGQNAGRWGAFYDSNKTFISGISPDKYNTVFETPENAAYIRFTVDYNNNNPDFARNVIFAKSTIAVPFEPYHEPQSLSISTPTGLPAIPVDTDGNYTDVNGQQWIADYIDLKRGKYVQRVWQKTFDGSESWGLYGNTGFLLDNILPEKMSNREMLCNQFRTRGGGTNSNIMIVGAFSTNSSIYIENCTLVDNTLVDGMLSKWKMHLAKHPLVVTTYLNEQVERDLTPEEIETYKNLVTYAGTTIVENDSDCWMDVTYKASTSGKSKNEALRWYFKNVMPLVE